MTSLTLEMSPKLLGSETGNFVLTMLMPTCMSRCVTMSPLLAPTDVLGDRLLLCRAALKTVTPCATAVFLCRVLCVGGMGRAVGVSRFTRRLRKKENISCEDLR